MKKSILLLFSLILLFIEYTQSDMCCSDNCYCASMNILRFQEKKGWNAVLTNCGRTAYRKDASEYRHGGLVTNRPLKDGEIFEILIEKTNNYGHSIDIGVTLQPPLDIEDSEYICYKEDGTWALDYDNVIQDGVKVANFTLDMAELKAGDRIGVMRKTDRSLHIYRNGTDMGVIGKHVPTGVYGIFDLSNSVDQVSITGYEINT